MTGDDLKAIRNRMGLSQVKFAAMLKDAVGVGGNRSTLREWEQGDRPINPSVVAFLEAIEAEGGIPADPPPPAQGRDSAPPPPPGVGQPQAPLFVDTVGAQKVCEQLFEMIATGVGMIGAATGSRKLQNDGLIILEDKVALGQAWGKLAETNETFRNLLMSADRQGAYLAIALATGTTAGKIWQNHAYREPASVVDAAEQLRHDLNGVDEPAAVG